MPPRIAPRLPQLKLIWFAIAGSVVIYGIVAFVMIEPNPDLSTERLYGFVSNPMSFILGIAALAAFFASYAIPGLVIRSRRKTDRTTVSPPEPPSAFEIAPEVMSALIIRFALLEAPAVIGLVGAFVMREWRFFLPFGVLALVGLVLTYPTASLVRSLDSTSR
ncbi:MAG: hypothetical protein R3338_04835 [Thermoanaerobaculia bacterium]|nr:hypothetical protein [Thermoanaerobaculia bacterium]